MYGGGIYSFESVKEIVVTDGFKSLREDQKQCQSLESFEQCTTNKLMEKIVRYCSCYPFELSKFTDDKEVKFFVPFRYRNYFFFLP